MSRCTVRFERSGVDYKGPILRLFLDSFSQFTEDAVIDFLIMSKVTFYEGWSQSQQFETTFENEKWSLKQGKATPTNEEKLTDGFFWPVPLSERFGTRYNLWSFPSAIVHLKKGAIEAGNWDSFPGYIIDKTAALSLGPARGKGFKEMVGDRKTAKKAKRLSKKGGSRTKTEVSF